MNDLISRQAALDAIDKNRQDLLFLRMYVAEYILVHYGRRVIEELPTADPVKNKLQCAIDGKTEEEIYDFLSWLMFEYAKQYTDSRNAVIQWLREDDTERRTDE